MLALGNSVIAAEAAPAVVRGGESAAAAYGEGDHQRTTRPGLPAGVPLLSGRRADAVNLRKREAVELESNNPAPIRRWQRQVEA